MSALRSRRIAAATASLLAFLLCIPAAGAWSLTPTTPLQTGDAAVQAGAAWTTALSASAFPGDPGAVAVAAVACALGDVSGDGVADVLVLARDPASGVQRLHALAGPGFTQVIWQKASSVAQLLHCAPDLDLDGSLDPIVQTLAEATGTAAMGATDQARNKVQQVLDGASGAALLGRVGADAVTGAAVPAAGMAAGAAHQATSILLPAAAGAAAYLKTEATTALIPIPGGLPVPLGPLTATAAAAAELQVLDAAGSVVATITIDEPGVQPLALAPVPLTGGLPDVAVLTSAAAPIQQVAARAPELALYAADGALAWSTRLPASTGLPILVPQAGDLNLDGVGDLIVTTVQQGVQAAPGAAFHVLSGVDGSILFDSGPAVTGLVAALPLGQLPGGAALLKVTAPAAGGALSLSALDGAGSVLWSVDVDRLAAPANAVLDPFTGDLAGFTDLTGDAIPDVAVATHVGDALALLAIDGLTGEVAWNASVPGAHRVVPLAIGAVQRADGQASAGLHMAEGLVREAVPGGAAVLLALGATTSQATLALLDSATGAVLWSVSSAVPTSGGLPSLSVDAAGDLNGDGTQDVLVTASYASGDAGLATATAVSGATGRSLFAASSDSSGPEPLDFGTDAVGGTTTGSPASGDSSGIPGPGLVAGAAALAVAALGRRRRAW